MYFSEDDKVVCETPSLSNEEILNEPQAVKVSWLNTEIPDEDTRYNFTYKADPEIKHIEPKLTIIGYALVIEQIFSFFFQLRSSLNYGLYLI